MSGVFVNGECVSGSCMIFNDISNAPQLLGVVLILAGILTGVFWWINSNTGVYEQELEDNSILN